MTRIAGLILLIFGLLPIANWIGGGHEAPWYSDRLDLWFSGGAIVLGVAALAVILLRKRPEIWPAGVWDRIAGRWQLAGIKADLGIAVVAGMSYATVSRLVLSAKPLLIDEIIQVYQARIFASGRLWLPAPEHPEFTSAMHLIDHAGKVYGQFPAGGPAMLTLGTLVGAEWLVGPVFAAASVLLFARILRRVESGRGTALAALLLFAFSPFALFLGGSMMNHITVLTWLLMAALALVTATASEEARPRAAFICGLGLGLAATIRPMDAVAFALPAAAWLLWRARRGGRDVVALLASGAGVAIPVALLLYINYQWTGDPLRFGYIELWGKSHELGFHEAPWGPPHTPMRGLELINLYLLRLQTYFFETPVPSLLFATAALLLVRRVAAFDRWVVAGSGLLLLAYWAYWHDGFYLGPRFVYPLAPWLALWTARLPGVLAERQVSEPMRRGVLVAGVTALVMGGVMLVPDRVRQYGSSALPLRHDFDGVLRKAGITNQVVLVHEDWTSRRMARLWALGVGRAEAEQLLSETDSCELETVLGQLERDRPGAVDVGTALRAIRVPAATLTVPAGTDSTIRVRPGAEWTMRCHDELERDSHGTALLPPLLGPQRSGNRYIRDLGELNRRVPEAASAGWILLGWDAVADRVRLSRIHPDTSAY